MRCLFSIQIATIAKRVGMVMMMMVLEQYIYETNRGLTVL